MKAHKNIYKQAQRFAEITKQLIISGHILKAKQNIKKAEDIFMNGSSEIRNAISNVYVYSVTSFMELHHCNIKDFLPSTLQKEYYKQVYSLGV